MNVMKLRTKGIFWIKLKTESEQFMNQRTSRVYLKEHTYWEEGKLFFSQLKETQIFLSSSPDIQRKSGQTCSVDRRLIIERWWIISKNERWRFSELTKALKPKHENFRNVVSETTKEIE